VAFLDGMEEREAWIGGMDREWYGLSGQCFSVCGSVYKQLDEVRTHRRYNKPKFCTIYGIKITFKNFVSGVCKFTVNKYM
jgi:hypothetical protein